MGEAVRVGLIGRDERPFEIFSLQVVAGPLLEGGGECGP